MVHPLNTLSIEEAAARHWDVIVAGSSFAAMFFIRGLPEGLSVLVLEKGQFFDHAAQAEDQKAPGWERIRQRNDSGVNKTWVAYSIFGGNSNFWSGQTPRFHPNDFRLAEKYGVGVDWPLSYDELEPYYQEAETVMEIAGGGSDHVLPRRRPFPYPPHKGSRSDRYFQAQGTGWVPSPSARSNGGERPDCCANGVCKICPVDAKFTILNGLRHFSRDTLRIVLEAEVRSVSIANTTANGVLVEHSGRDWEISGDLVALGTNALFNAAVLLRSGLKSPVLGRYLHEQMSRRVTIDGKIPNYFGGQRITGHCYDHYDGEFRRESGAALIENFNAPPIFRFEPGRWTERVSLKVISEALPLADNRVVLDEDGEPSIEWHGFGAYAEKGLDRAIAALPDSLHFPIEDIEVHQLSGSEAHIQGTTRMGQNPQESVVDDTLRTHEVGNLLALGSGAFPSCSPANPTLTLSALSLRAARLL